MSDLGLLSGSEQCTVCQEAHGGYGSPLRPAEDIGYHSRGRRAEEIVHWLGQLSKKQVFGGMGTLGWIASADGPWKDLFIVGLARLTAFQNN